MWGHKYAALYLMRFLSMLPEQWFLVAGHFWEDEDLKLRRVAIETKEKRVNKTWQG